MIQRLLLSEEYFIIVLDIVMAEIVFKFANFLIIQLIISFFKNALYYPN